jgi:hypothetical protein
LEHLRSSGVPALPQGPSFRSGLFCPGPSSLIRPHPPHSQAQPDFAAERAYTGCRRCVSVLLSPTPRQPTSGSVLSLAILCRHVVLWDPGKFLGCEHPVPSPTTLAFDLSGGSRHFRSPTLRFPWEGSFRGCPTVHFRYNLSTCSPPLSEPTGLPPSRRGLLLPGFRRFGHPLRRRISLQRQLGNFLWRVFPR